MHRYLLDASAILAFMSHEPGADRVRAVLLTGEAGVSAVNLHEVAAKLISRGMSSIDAEFQCRSMGLEVIAADEEVAFAAAGLVPLTRALGLSLGDRMCLATAMRDGAIAMTADRVWASMPDITMEVIR
jgi:PIN domain nuclease of toxin-antitoxin system